MKPRAGKRELVEGLPRVAAAFKRAAASLAVMTIKELDLPVLARSREPVPVSLAKQCFLAARAGASAVVAKRRVDPPVTVVIDLAPGTGMIDASRTPRGPAIPVPTAGTYLAWQAAVDGDTAIDHLVLAQPLQASRSALVARHGLLKAHARPGAAQVVGIPGASDPVDVPLLDMAMDVAKHVISASKNFNTSIIIADNVTLDVPHLVLKTIKDRLKYGDMLVSYPAATIEIMAKDPDADVDLARFFGVNVAGISEPGLLLQAYQEQLKSLGFTHVEALPLHADPASRTPACVLLWCTRRPKVDVGLGSILDGAGEAGPALVQATWDAFTGGGRSLDRFVHDDLPKARQSVLDPATILVQDRHGGFAKPLGVDTDAAWKALLHREKFTTMKVDGTVVVKKAISSTDLNNRSTCIQGNIKKRLRVGDGLPVIIVDRRTGAEMPGAFAEDGRLEGIAAWQKAHDADIQDGNFLFMATIPGKDATRVLLDYYQQKYPVLAYLADFLASWREIAATAR